MATTKGSRTAKPAWKLWHEVVKLRENVRSGELSLATFAADLYQVVMGEVTDDAVNRQMR